MRFSIVRWVLAAGCWYLSYRFMSGALQRSGMDALPAILGGMMSFLGAMILTAPETAFRVAELCARPFESIFFPSDRLSKPPLSYKLARRYCQEQRLEEAANEYESLIYSYPDEKNAYVELLDVATQLGDTELHAKYAALFKKRFHKDAPDV